MEENNDYLPRVYDEILKDKLESSGAVLITGCKWCGKTMTGAHQANSILYMQDPNQRKNFQNIADSKPSLLLEGATPRLIDEWQMSTVLWDAVRFECDRRQEMSQFILTGSTVPLDSEKAHSGTGRIARMQMRTMSLYESKESNGSVSLKDLFDGNTDIQGISQLTIEDLSYLICRGGWPASLKVKNKKNAIRMAQNYVDAIANEDIFRLDSEQENANLRLERNPERAYSILRSLARNICTMANNKTLLDDITANDNGISASTLDKYLNALRRLFVIEDQQAWKPSMRSKSALRTSAKRHFVDPSIATAVMRTNPEKLLMDFESFGFLFESLCTRDMRAYSQVNDGEVFHYRDKTGLEADMIISLRDGRWGAAEVKLGTKQIEEAAKNLLTLKEKINTDKMGNPSFLMVITGGQYAYKRNDGILVVPLGCLKP
ncbi:MAG: ATP-binding protein [Bacteroidales bacterium]|nr:ATP-binding protein [Bacteroidales bacterium]